jgi:UDP-N-acetyl-2-amino-2-deoxyglucuronate dehydrogenase
MKKNFAIIGCGRIGKRHAENIVKVGNLIAVCDVDYENALELSAQYGANLYLSIEDLLASEPGINVVSICTPNGFHAYQSIVSLNNGKHVLCEKPMSINSIDAQNMIDASIKANRQLFIVKSARYNPLIIALKQIIADDSLGNIYSFHLNCVWNRSKNYYETGWRGSNDLDGGTLFTQFSHYIDILFLLMGEHKTMTGYRKNFHHINVIDFEDTGTICMEMKSGAVGTIHYSVNAHEVNHEISLLVVAEKGTIQLGGEYMNSILYQQPKLLDTSLMDRVSKANDYGHYRGSSSNHEQVYENVCKALNGEKNDITDGADAIKTVKFIEDFYNKIKIT